MAFHISSPVGTGTFATGSIGPLIGEAGIGFYRITAPVNVIVEPTRGAVDEADRPTLTEFEADVRVAGKAAARFTCAIGRLPIQAYADSSNRQQIPLMCDFDRARLEALETLRAGGNLRLDFTFHGRFSNGRAASAAEGLDINRGVWIDLLAQMNYQQTLLIEVPLPDPARQPELSAVAALLAEAQGHLMSGQDRDAVGTLSDLLDRLALTLRDNDDPDSEITRVLFADSRSMTKADRLRVLRRSLQLLVHPARHQADVTANIDWSRIDAAQLIIMTAAFLNELSAPGARPPSAPAPAPSA